MEGYDPFDEVPTVDMGKEVYDSLSESGSATVGGGTAVAEVETEGVMEHG